MTLQPETSMCEFCGGVIVNDTLVYVQRDRFADGLVFRYQHSEHGPLPPSRLRHHDLDHTPRCTTDGVCRP